MVVSLYDYLVRKFRPRRPVVFKIRKIKNYGSYYYSGSKHYITIDSQSSGQMLIEVLQHEFSHLLQKNKYVINGHNDEFGKCFARVYRAYLEWLDL